LSMPQYISLSSIRILGACSLTIIQKWRSDARWFRALAMMPYDTQQPQ
jgi:hypothetical protein